VPSDGKVLSNSHQARPFPEQPPDRLASSEAKHALEETPCAE
jgi:hypothetical protein